MHCETELLRSLWPVLRELCPTFLSSILSLLVNDVTFVTLISMEQERRFQASVGAPRHSQVRVLRPH
jgi:hypothetical protein